MNRALFNLDKAALDNVHQYSLDILKDTGIRFPSEKALAVFKHNGLRVDGDMVFFGAKDIQIAMDGVPAAFTLEARNPDRSIRIGEDNYVMAPGYGPPFIIEPTGEKRDATREDMAVFCKLVQTSKYLDFNSAMVVQPKDTRPETAHLDILLAIMTLTDKPLMGSSASQAAASDSLKLARMIWGALDRPVMLSLIDSLSPLQYAQDSVEALMVFAEAGQPAIIHSACTLGLTGPITTAGALVVSNATTLAGICLAQLINPGTPLVYGLGGSPMDMRTGGYVNASPEDAKHVAIAGAMGSYYRMPCRGQGALTESFCLDYQAGMESALLMTVAALSGIHVGLHACGTFGSMLAMSFEKFIADEDLCGAVKQLMKPLELTDDALALDLIRQMGTSGEYLMQDHTLNRCRTEFFIPDLGIRTLHNDWMEMAPREITARAGLLLEKRLAEYKKPAIDKELENRLVAYAEQRKQEL
ncbi:MAG: trimethylamine methyltransferase family protein [Deltaproteobacteria bacterium]|jgi:trimethylamine--corrinoid protein Co-methyltransferase|nr:trimethylamine methyltransferase family protein [Deltaproteobacteria bacterium]